MNQEPRTETLGQGDWEVRDQKHSDQRSEIRDQDEKCGRMELIMQILVGNMRIAVEDGKLGI